ncbi:MAG: bifunctional riboflavin kinase/FAD synthetase [Lachnospiraceae bacterium]|nr:bifunctional riboflavin kinase/FAD synthetase [Lachnospiraceae bacterium]
MQYIEGLNEYTETEKSAVTFGKFDGIHMGHQKLVEQVIRCCEKENLKSVMCAFEMRRTDILMPPDERKERLEGKLDYLVECPFSDELRHMGAEDFIKKIIKGVFHAEYVVVGTDFRFGYGKEGDVHTLEAFEQKYHYKAIIVEKAQYEGREISSSFIKKLVKAGEIEVANYLLTYPYTLKGVVEHGKRLGRTLGFPTCNVEWPVEKAMPPRGVYVSNVYVDGEKYGAISNIGVKPTVSNENRVLIESYLYGYAGDAYGKNVKIELLQFERPEQKFASIDEMKARVSKDIEYGSEYFGRE